MCSLAGLSDALRRHWRALTSAGPLLLVLGSLPLFACVGGAGRSSTTGGPGRPPPLGKYGSKGNRRVEQRRATEPEGVVPVPERVNVCLACGDRFWKGKRGRFCCQKCRNQGDRRRPQVNVCVACGDTFWNGKRGRFCCQKCRNQGDRRLEKVNVCVACGSRFWNGKRGRYRCVTCRSQGIRILRCRLCGYEIGGGWRQSTRCPMCAGRT
jgi:hypothetical protein